IVVPGPRLHGSTGNGLAAAPVMDGPTAVPTAPARAIPRPRRTRRFSKPLCATGSGSDDARADCFVMVASPAVSCRRSFSAGIERIPTLHDGFLKIGYPYREIVE